MKVSGLVLSVQILAFLLIIKPINLYAHPLSELIRSKVATKAFDAEIMSELRTEAYKYADAHGRVTPELQEALYEIEQEVISTAGSSEKASFQTLIADLGAKMRGEIGVPQVSKSFWHLHGSELDHFRSTPKLPEKVDYVIIGAGLTGTSSAYHLLEGLKKSGIDKKIIVLEKDHPAAQASGKNGGNFQLLPESYVGNYDGLVAERVKVLKGTRPEMTEEARFELAEKQAWLLVKLSIKNSRRFIDLVTKESIACDFSHAGWVRVASSKYEEERLIEDTAWIEKMIHQELATALPSRERAELETVAATMSILEAEEVAERFHLPKEYKARLITDNGNYHPYKFVISAFRQLISEGVGLYTGVKVLKVTPVSDDQVMIETNEGVIEASKVIVATNAFTPQIFPELEAIQCLPSQILNYEHVSNHLAGTTITGKNGDRYFNFPLSTSYADPSGDGSLRGMLHYGLDPGVVIKDPDHTPVYDDHMRRMMGEVQERFPETVGQPPSRAWCGPMAFTDDRTPIVGFMHYPAAPKVPVKSVIIAAAFQGYGGSFCTQSGYVAASMALSGETHPDVPEEIFSPQRFFK